MNLHNDGQYKAALEAGKRLLKLRPDEGYTLRLMASCYFFLDQYDLAIDCLQKAVAGHPGWTAGSTDLFHALSEAGRYTEAFAEMKRFLFLRDCKEYDEYLVGFITASNCFPNDKAADVVEDIKRDMRRGNTEEFDLVANHAIEIYSEKPDKETDVEI